MLAYMCIYMHTNIFHIKKNQNLLPFLCGDWSLTDVSEWSWMTRFFLKLFWFYLLPWKLMCYLQLPQSFQYCIHCIMFPIEFSWKKTYLLYCATNNVDHLIILCLGFFYDLFSVAHFCNYIKVHKQYSFCYCFTDFVLFECFIKLSLLSIEYPYLKMNCELVSTCLYM